MQTKISSKYIILKHKAGSLRVVDDHENELELDIETQKLATDLLSKLEVADEEPAIVKALKKIGFKFGKNKSVGWKPEDRNLI